MGHDDKPDANLFCYCYVTLMIMNNKEDKWLKCQTNLI